MICNQTTYSIQIMNTTPQMRAEFSSSARDTPNILKTIIMSLVRQTPLWDTMK